MSDKVIVISLTSSGKELSDTVDKIQKSCDKYKVDFYPILTQFAYIDDTKATEVEITIDNYDGSGKSITINPQNTVCFARGGVTTSQIGMAMLTIFENTGMFVINERSVMELCANKLSTAIELDRFKIPTPRTAFVANITSLDASLKKIGNKFPVVVKTLTGAEGVGVSIINTYESLKSVLQTLWKFDAEIIIQEYVEIKNDVRSLVLDGKVVAAAMRGKAPKDFRTNLARGSKGGPYTLSDAEIKIVEKAAKCFGCFYVGVDSVLVNGKPYIIEMNASPGSGNVYRSYFEQDDGADITGQKLVDRLVKYAIDKDHWHYNTRESGLVESIDIVGVGVFSAKLDTGNESYNVLHVESISEKDGKVSFTTAGKKFTKPIVSHVKIRTSSASDPERRPVVELDLKFRNRNFKNVRFSLVSRAKNKYPVLIGSKFLHSAKISVNVSKMYELPEQTESPLNKWVEKLFEKHTNLKSEEFIRDAIPLKFSNIRNVKDVLELKESLKLLETKEGVSKDLIENALEYCDSTLKEKVKDRVYQVYNKEQEMPIDKDFDTYLTTISESTAIGTDAELKSLLKFLQSTKITETNKLNESSDLEAAFKKKYGNKWKSVAYAMAWNIHKNSNELTEAEGKKFSAAQKKKILDKKNGPGKAFGLDAKKKILSKGKEKKPSGKGGDMYQKFLKISGGNEKRAAAATRFLKYNKGNPRHKGSPKQHGYNPKVKDGDVSGRFRAKRYYGKQPGGKWDQIRHAVAVKIAKGTQNLSGLAKGRGKKKA